MFLIVRITISLGYAPFRPQIDHLSHFSFFSWGVPLSHAHALPQGVGCVVCVCICMRIMRNENSEQYVEDNPCYPPQSGFSHYSHMRIVDKLTEKRQKGFLVYRRKFLVHFWFGCVSNEIFCLVLLAFEFNIVEGG